MTVKGRREAGGGEETTADSSSVGPPEKAQTLVSERFRATGEVDYFRVVDHPLRTVRFGAQCCARRLATSQFPALSFRQMTLTWIAPGPTAPRQHRGIS